MKTNPTSNYQLRHANFFVSKSWSRAMGLPVLVGILLLLVMNADAQTQPPDTLSITAYGASTGSSDNTADIQACINAAQTAGEGVWIPAGTWKTKGSLSATGILIAGAGMNSSIIFREQSVSNNITATQLGLSSCTVQDIGIDSSAPGRNTTDSYGINMKGVGWLIQRVWIHHSNAGIWASGSSGTVQDCILTNTYADGVNINNSGTSASQAGANLTIQNCIQYGAGDDGFAINSQGDGSGWTNMVNPRIIGCTSLNDQGANGVGVYGGLNPLVQSCLISNTTSEAGILVASYGSGGFGITNGLIENNLVYSSGTVDASACIVTYDPRTSATFIGNTLNNSKGAGFQVGTPTFATAGNLLFGPNNVINHPAGSGIAIQSGVVGSGIFITNTVENLNSGQSAFVNGSSTFTTTLRGNSWQGSPGAGVTFYSGTFTSDAVLSLIGNENQELYGVTLGDSSAQWTIDGYSFGPYPSAHLTYGGSGAYAYSGFLGGGGTSGDPSFDTVLNDGELGINNGVVTLEGLTSGTVYSVMFLECDTRSGVGTRTFQITTGSASSPSQSYAFPGGAAALGGYIICTFTASGSTQTFTNSNAYGYQLNGVLVEQQ